VLADGLEERRAPAREARVVLGEHLADQRLKRLDERRVRHVALQLVVLAADEEAALSRDGHVNFLHHGRLADARVASDEQHLARALRHPPKRRQERLDVLLAAVQGLRELQGRGYVVRANAEVRDDAVALELLAARVEVGGQPVAALVAKLRSLLEELHHDRGDRCGDRGVELARATRHAREVRVHELHRVA
jgi:hypothetical protein